MGGTRSCLVSSTKIESSQNFEHRPQSPCIPELAVPWSLTGPVELGRPPSGIRSSEGLGGTPPRRTVWSANATMLKRKLPAVGAAHRLWTAKVRTRPSCRGA